MKILNNDKLVELPEDHPLYKIFSKVRKDLQEQTSNNSSDNG